MIRCEPMGIWSSDFFLIGEDHRSSMKHEAWGHGTISVDGEPLAVRYQGILSYHWTLERERTGLILCRARGVRTAGGRVEGFEVQSPMGPFLVRRKTRFRRAFLVERSGEVIAAILPRHPLTRRATIDAAEQVWDFATLTFVFWLVVEAWKEAAA